MSSCPTLPLTCAKVACLTFCPTVRLLGKLPHRCSAPRHRLDSARLDSARLDSTRLDSTRLGFTRLNTRRYRTACRWARACEVQVVACHIDGCVAQRAHGMHAERTLHMHMYAHVYVYAWLNERTECMQRGHCACAWRACPMCTCTECIQREHCMHGVSLCTCCTCGALRLHECTGH